METTLHPLKKHYKKDDFELILYLTFDVLSIIEAKKCLLNLLKLF